MNLLYTQADIDKLQADNDVLASELKLFAEKAQQLHQGDRVILDIRDREIQHLRNRNKEADDIIKELVEEVIRLRRPVDQYGDGDVVYRAWGHLGREL